ncbi:MAG: RNA polymerase factor sigma-54 [Bacteroidota bacterium]
MTLGIELRLRQHLAVTPQLQQALRLLRLSSLEFNEEVQQALTMNPFLEEESDSPATGALAAGSGPVGEAGPADAPENKAPGDEAGEWPVTGAASGSPGSGDEDDWTTWSAAPVGMREQLRRQLLFFPLSERERALGNLVIDELSDAGYFETSIEEFTALLSAEYQVTTREVLAALRRVQQLEPTGIAARSLQECLLLQLEAQPQGTPGLDIAREIVGRHFERLARRDFSALQQLIGCDDTALHTARALIRRLNPRPGSGFGPDETRYVVPDILVSKGEGPWTWICKINPAVLPRLRINHSYAEIAARRGACDPAFAGQLQEARWFLRNIRQRFTTIQRVADAIVARQRAFFNYGEAAMKPLVLKDIASELELHESTVCRVTNGKYMATPRGVFEFRYFFSRQLAMADGASCSALAIRALMKEMIAAESPGQPFSDAQLAHLLAGQGLNLARRTVTKYRTLMRIPSVELRRVGAGGGFSAL